MQNATVVVREIPAYRVGELAAKVEKINRRASKHNLRHGDVGGSFTLEEGEIRTVRFGGDHISNPCRRTVDLQTVRLIGPTLKMQGFRFLGKIDHSGGKVGGKWQNLVMSAPGETVPVEYRTAPPHCDHCQTNRYRLDTFVLIDHDGKTRQIGRNCLADYIGHNPESIIQAFDMIKQMVGDLDEECEGWGGHGFRYGAKPVDVLAYTAAVVEKCGWTSKSNENLELGKVATAKIVDEMMFSKNVENRIRPTDEHYKTADLALDYLNNKFSKNPNLNEYGYTLTTLTRRDFIETKYFGYVASGLNVYNRYIEREIARKAELTNSKPSTHIGRIGERLTLPVQVMRRHSFNGQFGLTTIYTFRADNGAILVWFATGQGDNGNGLDRGDNLIVKATVKAHKSNRESGQPETIVNRVVVVERLNSEPTGK